MLFMPSFEYWTMKSSLAPSSSYVFLTRTTPRTPKRNNKVSIFLLFARVSTKKNPSRCEHLARNTIIIWIKTLALLAIHHQLIHCAPASHVRISFCFFTYSKFFFAISIVLQQSSFFSFIQFLSLWTIQNYLCNEEKKITTAKFAWKKKWKR